eukprot:scaffold6111_cov107-Isochrysis_galbana.AAC.8
MTEPPIDDTEARDREQDAPGTNGAKHRAPLHGHTGAVPPDKALSDMRSGMPHSTTSGSSATAPATASRSTTRGRPPCARTNPSSQRRATMSSHTYLASLNRWSTGWIVPDV